MIGIETTQLNTSPNVNTDLLYLVPGLCKKKNLKTKTNTILALIIITLFIITLAIKSIVQIDEFGDAAQILANYFQTNATDMSVFYYENTTNQFCKAIGDENLSYISHPIALFIVVVGMLLTWRRSHLTKLCFARPGLPMIIHPYKKHDRLNSAFVYGLIASNVIGLVFKLAGDPNYLGVFQSIKDPLKPNEPLEPTGLAVYLLQIINICIISLRYFPVLVAFNLNSFFVYFLTTLYVFIDYFIQIVEIGICLFIYKAKK